MAYFEQPCNYEIWCLVSTLVSLFEDEVLIKYCIYPTDWCKIDFWAFWSFLANNENGKPLPKLVLKVGKEKRVEDGNVSESSEHSHHKKKKKKHKHKEEVSGHYVSCRKN